MTPQHTKGEIYRIVCERFDKWYPTAAQHPGGQCVRWACTLMGVALERGLRPKIQAGSMSWPIVTPEQDDGVSPTHFSYEWSPGSPESLMQLATGGLPEMHVWVALPDQNEILDFSTKSFPEEAKRHGLVWRTPPPPDYLWCRAGEQPPRVHYKPDLQAIAFILNHMRGEGAQTVRLQPKAGKWKDGRVMPSHP